jgi:hypothetical protein
VCGGEGGDGGGLEGSDELLNRKRWFWGSWERERRRIITAMTP